MTDRSDESRIERLYRQVRERELARLRRADGRSRPRSKVYNPAGNPQRNLPKIWRKCSGTRKDGQPCNAPAVRGSSRCVAHGGMRDAPNARGNRQRFRDGRLQTWAEAMACQRLWRAASPEAQRAVIHAETPIPSPRLRAPQIINRARGAQAWADGPRQWAQWIAKQKAVAQIWKAIHEDDERPATWHDEFLFHK